MSILGVDLGGTNVRAGIVKDNRLVKVAASAINGQGSQKEVVEQVFGVMDPLVHRGLKGIGVGVPSVVDLKRGIIYDVVNIPSWKKVPLKDFLEKRYRLPVYINNDANCFAVGEKYFGQARNYDNAVGLIVGTGLGAGVITNGKLYSGANCGAGEFGMISYLDHNHEYYASGQFFKNVYRTSGRELSERAKRGDAEALRIFAEFGGHLGEAIKTILYAVDPDIIVLGGSVSQSYRFFRQAMWESIGTFIYTLVLKNIKVGVTRVRNIAILGAAALYYDAIRK
jgi:glucokinase